MTTENSTDTTAQDEVKNPGALLAKNRDLLAKLKQVQDELVTTQDALTTTQTALEASKADVTAWRGKWHAAAVMDPLDRLLKPTTGLPVRYVKELALEKGIIRMIPDDDGFERPVWHDKDGNPMAEPERVWNYLCNLNDSELNSVLVGTGASGGGAGSSGTFATYKPPAPKESDRAPTAFGLR